jgi:hypothetical protein
MIHNLNRHGGPCWSRERGYHHPTPMSPVMQHVLLAAAARKAKPEKDDAKPSSKEEPPSQD